MHTQQNVGHAYIELYKSTFPLIEKLKTFYLRDGIGRKKALRSRQRQRTITMNLTMMKEKETSSHLLREQLKHIIKH